MKNKITRHKPAFKGKIKNLFKLKPNDLFLDLTLGDGGHTQEALEAGARVVSFDVDPISIRRALRFIPKKYSKNWTVVNSNMVEVSKVLNKLNINQFNAIVIDLGPSQYQISASLRGFSFTSNKALDMRLDKNLGVKAQDLIAALSQKEIKQLLLLADEPLSGQIARLIVNTRKIKPIVTCKELAELITRIKNRQGRIHPATQVFLALRMAVNLEREVIQKTLPQLANFLKPNGILGIISFHSGEDKLIKQFGKKAQTNLGLRVIYKKPLRPTVEEINNNPKIRSAKIRLFKKI